MNIIEALQRHDYPAVFGWIIALAIGISVHEFAHAKFADLAGDPTPRKAGRVTLNPLAHYDPIGSTLILLVGMGWGKPVPINSTLFRHPRSDSLKVALGGIGANIVTAGLFGLIFRTGIVPDAYQSLLVMIVTLNLILAFFNIIPLYPLDGSHALISLLGPEAARKVAQFYMRYGIMPLFGLLAAFWIVPPLGLIIWGPVGLLTSLFTGVGLS